MTDLERKLSDSLKGVGDTYAPRNVAAAREEFEARRRRRFVWQLSGGIAFAGAAVAAVLFFASAEPVSNDEVGPGPFKPASLDVLTRFAVSEEPLSIGAGDNYRLWIASREGGSVNRIELDSGITERIVLPGANELVVGAENVWASGEAGDYLRINEAAPDQVLDGDFVEEHGGAQLVDLAVGGRSTGAVWAVGEDGCLWELTEPADLCDPESPVTDVTADNDEVWVLDSNNGHAWQFYSEGGAARLVRSSSDNYYGVPASQYGDMTIVNDKLWVSGGGTIETVDLATGERKELEIDGDYADLAVGPETVWALAGWADGDERARVYEFSHDLEIIGVSDILRGEPSDLVADANGVWITIRYRNEVVYLSRGETAPPAPTALEEDDGTVDHGDVVMVFGKDGDIWAGYSDGSFGPLMQTPAEEAHPILVENIFTEGAPAVLFDRLRPGRPAELFHLDLATMTEEPIAEGWGPASDPTGPTQAWLGNSASVPWMVVATLFAEPTREVTVEGADNEPVQLRQLAWDAGGRFVYGLTTENSPRVVSIDSGGELEEVFADPDPEWHVAAIAPGGTQDSVTVVRVCCGATEPGSQAQTVELGEYSGWSSGGGINYRKIADLSDLDWGPDLLIMSLARADGLSATPNFETVTWGPSDAPGWIVSDGRRTFLVSEGSDTQEIPIDIDAGVDVNEDRNLN